MKIPYFQSIISIAIILSESRTSSSQSLVSLLTFNGEPMSFFHIAYLYDVVDYFILIESDETHSGAPKSFYYADQYKDVLNSFNSTGKIILERISFPQNMKWSWHREKYQRNMAREIILERMGPKPFVLIVGDADEITRKDLAANLTTRYREFDTPAHLRMIFHYYSFKWVTRDLWSQAFVINDVGLRNLTRHLSDIRVEKPIFYDNLIDNAGWHCSYFMNTSDIIKKVKSFAHQEFNREGVHQLEWVERCRKEGIDLFNRTKNALRRCDGHYGYPKCDTCKSLPQAELFDVPS
eukprot:gene11016-23015_t